jgi:nucleoside-diphosphate-sugar epimerase
VIQAVSPLLTLPKKPETTRRVLVTGALGFTGRYMVNELLAHGWEVWAMHPRPLAVSSSTPSNTMLRHVQADLLEATALANTLSHIQPHAVVHLAAVAFVAHGNAEDFYRTNLIGTRHLLAALANLPVPPRHILLASSANVYGITTEGKLNEDTALNPANDYAVSKVAMEMMASLWQHQLPITITRPFNYTGVGQSENFLIPKIIAHFKKRAPVIELGNLDVWRDFSDVRQVTAIYRQLLEADLHAPGATSSLTPHTIFNVGSEQLHSLRDILALAEALTGHQLEVRINPAFVRANEVKTLRADTSRLRSVLGEYRPIELRDTLAWMLQAS